MPIYEYECPVHGVFEEIILSSNGYVQKQIQCGFKEEAGVKVFCYKIAKRIPSLPVHPSHGKPTIIYRNPKTNEVRHAYSREQETSDGFVKEELKTPFERTKVEKELQARDDIENEIKTERQRILSSESRKNRQADIMANLKGICAESTNPGHAETLMKAAMNRDRKREVPKRKSNFHFAVNHKDASNLDKN